MNYKDFFPPIIIRAIKRLLRKKERHFDSFSEAEMACRNYGGYDNIELSQMVADKTIIYKNKMQRPYNINPTYLLLSGVLAKFYSENRKEKLTLLDFGGSCGAVYFDIKSVLGNEIKLEWNVYDLPEMIKSAKSQNLENQELKFFDNLDHIKSKIDIVHTSGTLHYVENVYEIMSKLMSLNAKYIVFNRMLFNETEDDYCIVQHSGYRGVGPGKVPTGYIDKDIDFAARIMAYKNFTSILEKQYDLEWVFSIGKEVNGIVEKGLLYKNKTYFA